MVSAYSNLPPAPLPRHRRTPESIYRSIHGTSRRPRQRLMSVLGEPSATKTTPASEGPRDPTPEEPKRVSRAICAAATRPRSKGLVFRDH